MSSSSSLSRLIQLPLDPGPFLGLKVCLRDVVAIDKDPRHTTIRILDGLKHEIDDALVDGAAGHRLGGIAGT